MRSCDNMILFHSGCHEFALTKIILHVHIQNGWIWKPFTIFCAWNIALKWQKSTEHDNSELENSSSTQKNGQFISLDLIMIMVSLFWLLIVVSSSFVAIFNNLLQFMFNVWIFVFSKSQLFSASHLYSRNQNYIQIRCIKLTLNRPVKHVLILRIGYFLFSSCHWCVFIQYTLVYSITWSIFVLKNFPCAFFMTKSAYQVADHFQFLFLWYTQAYIWNVVMGKVS